MTWQFQEQVIAVDFATEIDDVILKNLRDFKNHDCSFWNSKIVKWKHSVTSGCVEKLCISHTKLRDNGRGVRVPIGLRVIIFIRVSKILLNVAHSVRVWIVEFRNIKSGLPMLFIYLYNIWLVASVWIFNN